MTSRLFLRPSRLPDTSFRAFVVAIVVTLCIGIAPIRAIDGQPDSGSCGATENSDIIDKAFKALLESAIREALEQATEDALKHLGAVQQEERELVITALSQPGDADGRDTIDIVLVQPGKATEVGRTQRHRSENQLLEVSLTKVRSRSVTSSIATVNYCKQRKTGLATRQVLMEHDQKTGWHISGSARLGKDRDSP